MENFNLNKSKNFLLESDQIQEGKSITAYNFKGEPIKIDLSLIDTLAQQIGPALGYGDWQERVDNLDYKRILQAFAKRVLRLGDLESDPIKFKK